MGQVLHGSATTTAAVRQAIQHSQASLRALARRYGVNPKTIAKWRKRSAVADLPTGPKQPRSTVLSPEHEAIIVAFRRHTLLPLAWVAAVFEMALALAFITGAFFSEAAILAAAYVMFLACSFHGPSRWSGNRAEFGFFVDHFALIAGLMFAAVHGPGARLALRFGVAARQ